MKNWHWLFADETCRRELGAHPERLLEGAVPVKANPVRRVFRQGAYFLKCDTRFLHGFRREFRTALLLKRKRIPVTEALACGRCGSDSMLITRAVPHALSLAEYLEPGPPDRRFLENFAGFFRRFLESGFFHTDLHAGNVLYAPETGMFTLVDVHAAHPIRLWERGRREELFRVVMDLRRDLGKAAMLELLQKCGCSAPEKFYDAFLKLEARRLHAEWPRRRGQIRSGYPKFTTLTEGVYRSAGVAENELAQAERVPGTFEEYAAGFYLDLAHIPHRKALAFLPQERVLLYRKEELPPAPEELSLDFRSRLFPCGIYTPPEAWRLGPRGVPCLYDLKAAAKQLEEGV